MRSKLTLLISVHTLELLQPQNNFEKMINDSYLPSSRSLCLELLDTTFQRYILWFLSMQFHLSEVKNLKGKTHKGE